MSKEQTICDLKKPKPHLCQLNPGLRWFLILSLALAAFTVSAATNRFEGSIRAFERSDKTNSPPQGAVLFVGSSTIRKWTTLAKDFPKHKVINRGFGGSMYSDCDYYFDRIVTPYKPKVIVLYAGSNDLSGGKKPAQVEADCVEFFDKVKAALPETKIAIVSINAPPSRWKDLAKIKEVNKHLEDYAASHTNITYLDVFTPLLDKDDQPQRDLYLSDRLHPNAKGYAIWTKVVAPYLDRVD